MPFLISCLILDCHLSTHNIPPSKQCYIVLERVVVNLEANETLISYEWSSWIQKSYYSMESSYVVFNAMVISTQSISYLWMKSMLNHFPH